MFVTDSDIYGSSFTPISPIPMTDGENSNCKHFLVFRRVCHNDTITAQNVAILAHTLPIPLTASQFIINTSCQ